MYTFSCSVGEFSLLEITAHVCSPMQMANPISILIDIHPLYFHWVVGGKRMCCPEVPNINRIQGYTEVISVKQPYLVFEKTQVSFSENIQLYRLLVHWPLLLEGLACAMYNSEVPTSILAVDKKCWLGKQVIQIPRPEI